MSPALRILPCKRNSRSTFPTTYSVPISAPKRSTISGGPDTASSVSRFTLKNPKTPPAVLRVVARHTIQEPMRPFQIAILGNVNDGYEPHYTMNKVFTGCQQDIPFQYRWIPTETLEFDAPDTLRPFQGIVAGSGPYRSK